MRLGATIGYAHHTRAYVAKRSTVLEFITVSHAASPQVVIAIYAPQCRQRSHQASSSVGRCSVNAGAELDRFPETTENCRMASLCLPGPTGLMHGLGFNVFR